MSVLSKMLLFDWSMTYNCYEVGHTWTPHCSKAALQIGGSTFGEAMKMYTALYTLNLVLGKRRDLDALKFALRSILQSSFFLGFNAYAVIMTFCLTRHMFGKFYYLIVAHIPAIIASSLAIQIERPSRRPALAFYVANVAAETVYNKLVLKGIIKPIPFGDVFLFAASTAYVLYLSHKNGFAGSDPVTSASRFLIGACDFPVPIGFKGDRCNMGHQTDGEKGEGVPQDLELIDHQTTGEERKEMNPPSGCIINSHVGKKDRTTSNGNHRRGTPSDWNQLDGSVCPHSIIRSKGSAPAPSIWASAPSSSSASLACSSCSSCSVTGKSLTPPCTSCGNNLEMEGAIWPHNPEIMSLLTRPSLEGTSSCTLHAVHSFFRNFLIGFTGQTVLSVVMKPKQLLKDPINTVMQICWKRSITLGAFVGSFSALFKGSSCLLRHYQPSMSPPMMTFVSSLVAGSAAFMWRSPILAQYMMWKLIEKACYSAIESGHITRPYVLFNLLYAVSTAQLFYVAVMEPRIMRPSYNRFLNRVTHGCFALLNRNIIDIFGTNASYGYDPGFDPDLEQDYISEKFKESVMIWMI